MDSLDFFIACYRKKLKESGIPRDPASRTPEQQQGAAMVLAAARLEFAALLAVTQAGADNA